jgi:hypothetical protein
VHASPTRPCTDSYHCIAIANRPTHSPLHRLTPSKRLFLQQTTMQPHLKSSLSSGSSHAPLSLVDGRCILGEGKAAWSHGATMGEWPWRYLGQRVISSHGETSVSAALSNILSSSTLLSWFPCSSASSTGRVCTLSRVSSRPFSDAFLCFHPLWLQ